jgi:hypothetical protein
MKKLPSLAPPRCFKVAYGGVGPFGALEEPQDLSKGPI